MTIFKFSIISAISVLIPLATAAWKRKVIWRKYFLLIVFLFIGGVNDLMSYLLIKSNGTNNISSNLYQLVQFGFIVWLTKRWTSERKTWFHWGIFLLGLLFWILDNCILHSLFDNNSLFRMTGSVLLVFVCIDQINLQILNRHVSVIIPDILICSGFVFYYLYKALIEAFQLSAGTILPTYFITLWWVRCYINILTNLMIATAFLCYKSKTNYTILSSQQ